MAFGVAGYLCQSGSVLPMRHGHPGLDAARWRSVVQSRIPDPGCTSAADLPQAAGRTTMSDTISIPARRGKAAYVAANQVVCVINTYGEQVVDTWAFNRHDI